MAEAEPTIAEAIDAQHAAIVAYPGLSKVALGKGEKGLLGQIPLIGGVGDQLLSPFTKGGQIKAVRQNLTLAPEEQEFYEMLRSYNTRKIKSPSVPSAEVTSVGGIPVGQTNTRPTVPVKRAGTALDRRGGSKEKKNLITTFSDSKSNKSKTTDIQSRYAKETPKTGDGRRNMSAEIIKRALETKSEAAKNRILKEFPKAKTPEEMTRVEQEKFLRAVKKAKYR